MNSETDLKFALADFAYADLYDNQKLTQLDARFADWLAVQNAALAARYLAYRAGAPSERVAESNLLLETAQALEEFLVELFAISGARDVLRAAQAADDPLHVFKDKLVKAAVKRKRAQPARAFVIIEAELLPQLETGIEIELAIARFWQKNAAAENAVAIALLEEWAWSAANTDEGRVRTKNWISFKFPRKIDYFKLVETRALADDKASRVEGPAETLRRRDGFALTDTRGSLRAAMDQVHYCVYCHRNDGDYCSQGFPAKDEPGFKKNPLGVELTGCPLGEKISEAHVLKRDGATLAALAVIMIDNPLLPLTGHRICNDCMKACIYQKQDPVDIPQIETRILTDVLELPWGFEIYFLLTRWNPLNRARPYAEVYNGKHILIAGAGPAGCNLAYHLLQQGFGVAMIDGLKIEPLPQDIVGSAATPPRPVRDIASLNDSLDERVMLGFGGVAEYGITVRWDKNFLKLVYLTLARNQLFSVYGGVRLGGTIRIEDAWQLGFDHVALATGAGRPTVLPIKNNMARGIRQASDFLMALQLTGAAKTASLANLQVRLPALVIGGGLTGIDTATEVQAYYIRQVEKTLARYEALADAAALPANLSAEERSILHEHLAHGRLVRAERMRAAVVGEAPNFIPLLQSWGGVTVVYRKAMNQSPAYLRNHEEIEKALQEGIYYAERLEPIEACTDAYGSVEALRFARNIEAEGGEAIVELPARAVFIAAGSIPNTVYEREHNGTFTMQGKFFAAHRIEDCRLTSAASAKNCKSDGIGFFTSYTNDQHYVSYFGDNHPQFAGSVVKAMASAKRGASAITDLFPQRQRAEMEAWRKFVAMLDDRLHCAIVKVERYAARMSQITLHAPQAARSWRPGQVFRLQNFETQALKLSGTLLQMEGMAIHATNVDPERGEITLIANEVGATSRIAGSLQPGTRVILMGPTGSGIPTLVGGTMVVMGNASAVASLVDGTPTWRASGSRVVFIGHFENSYRAEALQPLIESLADQIYWVIHSGSALRKRRLQDKVFVGRLADFLDAARTSFAYGSWVPALSKLLLCDTSSVMAQTAPLLRELLDSSIDVIAAVNSPMQCMMKEVCAQCLCKHRRADGSDKYVFSCFNQHQPLYDVDFVNLALRQTQNGLQEKLSDAWLSYVMNQDSGVALTPQPTWAR